MNVELSIFPILAEDLDYQGGQGDSCRR